MGQRTHKKYAFQDHKMKHFLEREHSQTPLLMGRDTPSREGDPIYSRRLRRASTWLPQTQILDPAMVINTLFYVVLDQVGNRTRMSSNESVHAN